MPVAGAVVGEHAADGEAEAGASHEEKAHGGAMGLVGQDGGESDPALVVDGDVERLAAGAAGLAGTVAVNAVAGLDDAGKTLNTEMHLEQASKDPYGLPQPSHILPRSKPR